MESFLIDNEWGFPADFSEFARNRAYPVPTI